MLYLIITILLTSSFFILFRLFPRYNVNQFHAIVVNYTTCVITGLIFTNGFASVTKLSLSNNWVTPALLLGLLFLLTFFLMSLTVNKVSVTVASIANKTSLVIPVSASIFFFPVQAKAFTWINYLGILCAIVAIIFSSLKRNGQTGDSKAASKSSDFILPAMVFIFGGIIDTTINFLNYKHLGTPHFEMFPIVSFFSASAAGLLIVTISGITGKGKISQASLIGGIILGIPNYFSIYFLLKTLETFNNDGAFVFPLVNTGIILCSTLMASLFFKERLIPINLAGIVLAILAIIFIFL